MIVNAIGHDLPVEEAISAPRIHVENGHVHCEGGSDPAELDKLERRGYEIVRWRRRNSTSEVPRRSRCGRTGRCTRPATRDGGARNRRRRLAPTPSVRRPRDAGGARRPRRGHRRRAGGLADLRRRLANSDGRAAISARRSAATATRPSSLRRQMRRSSAGSRSAATRTRPAVTSPTSA